MGSAVRFFCICVLVLALESAAGCQVVIGLWLWVFESDLGTTLYRDIPEEIRELVEPLVAEAGYELVDVLIKRGRAPWSVRVIIDTNEGDGRVPVDRCAAISREIATNFDAADTFPGAYRLELSSPGLDRILAREKDFVGACGSEIRLETREPLDGRRRFRGRLLGFDEKEGLARIDVDGREWGIRFSDIARARKIYPFTSADFGKGA